MKYKQFIKETEDVQSVHDDGTILDGTILKDKGYSPSEMKSGIEVEKEHKNIWDLLKKWADEKQLELPFTEKQMYTIIAHAHLKEMPDYYTRLKKMENK